MSQARKILTSIEIQENQETDQPYRIVLLEFFKKFKFIGAEVYESSNSVKLSYAGKFSNLQDYSREVYSFLSKFFKGTFFQLKKSDFGGFHVLERGRTKLNIFHLSVKNNEKILTITIKSYVASTYQGMTFFYRDTDLQNQRFEKFVSSHRQTCDILVKALRLLDPEYLK